MLGMAPPPEVIDSIIILILAIGCVGFCLVGGLAYLIYRFAYKASKQAPPASDNDENPKD